jgi:TRAP-type C4-dicarboxylate transport system permease small subunit
MIRKFLDRLYVFSGGVSAAFLVLICALVTVQVIFNLITKLFGASVALTIPSYAEFAGFFLATASFLALAYTLTRGGHIRVTLVVQYLPKPLRLVLEIGALVLSGATAAYATWFMGRLTWDSYRFGDMSPGIIAVPIWIPQTSLTIGLGIFAIALIDLAVSTALVGKLVLISSQPNE